MSDESKAAEHPAPWRWDPNDQLLDADGGFVLRGDDDGIWPSEAARELIRLAPELEQALRFFVEMTAGMWPLHPKAAKAHELLATLDAARKAQS